MKKKPPKKPDHISQEDWDSVDIPELTDEELARMRPAAEVAPELVEAYRRSRGRPPKAVRKKPVAIRLDPDIISWFKARGPGYQSRINEALREWIGKH